jgi:NAD+ diphosphatase
MAHRTIAFLGSDILMDSPDGEPWLSPPRLEAVEEEAQRSFTWSGEAFEALSFPKEAGAALEAAGLIRMPIRQALSRWPEATLRPALKGLGLLNWMSTAKFCGACGTALADPAAADLEGGARSCPDCGRPTFPRISPAVIVLVTRGDQILLARNAKLPAGGRFGLLAGFVEAGETLEETAVREVREEAGIEIGDLSYVASQPWPFPDSLMLAFTARWLSGEARPDGEEIAELRWCGRDGLPEIPPKGSIARTLIDRFALA